MEGVVVTNSPPTSPRLYDRLNAIGMVLDDKDRRRCGSFAKTLRIMYQRYRRRLDEQDDMLEIADQLDTLASPITVSMGTD